MLLDAPSPDRRPAGRRDSRSSDRPVGRTPRRPRRRTSPGRRAGRRPSRYWRSSGAHDGSSGNSSTIARIIGRPRSLRLHGGAPEVRHRDGCSARRTAGRPRPLPRRTPRAPGTTPSRGAGRATTATRTQPPLEQRRGGRALEPADVVAPEPEPAEAERQPAAQRLGHATYVDSQSPPQCTGNCCPPTVAERANSTASTVPALGLDGSRTPCGCRAGCSSCASGPGPTRRARPRRWGCARRSRS